MFWVLTLAIKTFKNPFRCPTTGTPALTMFQGSVAAAYVDVVGF